VSKDEDGKPVINISPGDKKVTGKPVYLRDALTDTADKMDGLLGAPIVPDPKDPSKTLPWTTSRVLRFLSESKPISIDESGLRDGAHKEAFVKELLDGRGILAIPKPNNLVGFDMSDAFSKIPSKLMLVQFQQILS
jgi:hypothetical protein